ncbi:ScpA family protein [Castellaniella sp.]|uniref:segregation and condensation protein A n=1 Tax=Castellaniella sp. TaxID=1955812 RepID=UPI00355EE10A
MIDGVPTQEALPIPHGFVKNDGAGQGGRAALAHLYGEPLFDLPRDLYIPPEALEIFLESFEGPLDLLLYLIRRQNFNVLDIPMALLTEQYLAYVDQIQQHNLELAAEYLLMAALLIEIKSRMLLPRRADEAGEAADEDPRAELVRRLLEYERIQHAARSLDALPRLGRDFDVPGVHAGLAPAVVQPTVQALELHAAWLGLLQRVQWQASHRITREQLSVRDHMSHILRRLSGARFVEFSELLQERIHTGLPAAVLVVHFLALLELVRESLLDITQAEPYAPIYIRAAHVAAA